MWFLLLMLADAGDSIHHEKIEVGQSIERDVGYAIGVICDDPRIVTAEMKTVPTPGRQANDTNILTLKGEHEGTTQCRAGTDPNRVSYVYEIVVVPKRRR